jgi:hypothetical protein
MEGMRINHVDVTEDLHNFIVTYWVMHSVAPTRKQALMQYPPSIRELLKDDPAFNAHFRDGRQGGSTYRVRQSVDHCRDQWRLCTVGEGRQAIVYSDGSAEARTKAACDRLTKGQ